MVFPGFSGDLYHKYRPRRFSEMVGNKEIVKSLKAAINAPEPSQAYLLTGESGVGKTTSSRIIALSLNCKNKTNDLEPCLECSYCKSILSGSCSDVLELNAADNRGIDTIREITSKMSLASMFISKKVYIFDEAHALTKDAQSSFLKPLEDTAKDTYLILCTTNPEKLLPTLKNRCQQSKFKPLKPVELLGLLQEVSTYEGKELPTNILQKIAESAQGSPRNALVRLQQVFQLDTTNEVEIEIFLATEEAGGEELLQLFSSFSKNSNWSNIVSAYNEVKEMGAPAIGMCLAGYFRNKLAGTKSNDLAQIYAELLELFVVPFEENKVGENNLILNLFKASRLCKNLPSPFSKW